jgi:hypothetical protein
MTLRTFRLDQFVWVPEKRILRTTTSMLFGHNDGLINEDFHVKGEHHMISFTGDDDIDPDFFTYRPYDCSAEFMDIRIHYYSVHFDMVMPRENI